MRPIIALLLVPLLLCFAGGCARSKKKPPAVPEKDYAHQLGFGESGLREIDISTLPDLILTPTQRAALLQAVTNSQKYFGIEKAGVGFPASGVTRAQVVASLGAFAELLRSATDDATFNRELKSRFRALMSVGCDDAGTVLFTGYYTPIFDASLTRDATHAYPLFKRPRDLVQARGSSDQAQRRMADGSTQPYPDRATIEASHMLSGSELMWLADPFDCYLVQIQGSAKMRLSDGRIIEVGYDGTNGMAYRPIGGDLVADGKIAKDQLSFFTIRDFFRKNPQEVAVYTARNPRYVFFTTVKGGPFGSLGQPVTADVSIATDKSIFPRGGPTMVTTTLSGDSSSPYAGLRVDQDTGGAIRAPGRCDLYMGEGDANERRAGAQFAEGRLYYLLLKE